MKKTSLYNNHLKLNAKMVEFGGFNMPIQYQGISIEHNAVRKNVGIFDVSHMGEFFISGQDSSSFLNYVCTNNIDKIKIYNAQYNCFTNHDGGIIDDLIVYRCDESEYMLVVNASNIKKDWDWLISNVKNYNCKLSNESDNIGLISVQGPKSLDLINEVFKKDFSSIKKFRFDTIIYNKSKITISNTGYTGSKGYELYINNEIISIIWDKLINIGVNHNVSPIGLGARDTLRMEMGYCLYGNDIDDSTTPYEANLMWVTNLEKEFIGKETILSSIKNSSKKMINFKMIDRGIPRRGYDIADEFGNKIGNVTSGTFSPSNKIGIGIGYINKNYKIGDNIFISIRDKKVKAELIKLPISSG